ncbi:MAG: hypothetical protein AB7I42_22925 [Bradyrhizobium sp.]|uniref:hypothetical protein n=1 Tax=Bradyrhizobium sp. TaxID=376 RepID=UPI003D0AE58C
MVVEMLRRHAVGPLTALAVAAQAAAVLGGVVVGGFVPHWSVSPASALVVTDVAGRGCGSGGPALAMASAPTSLAVLDGTLYETDARCQSIHTIADGVATRVVGSGIRGNRLGTPDVARLNNPGDVTRGGDGMLYWTESQRYVKRVGYGGIVEVVADFGSGAVVHGIAADIGSIYVAVGGHARVYTIATPCTAPCGSVPLAGTGVAGFSGDGGPAELAKLNVPRDVAVHNGNVYIADQENYRIRRVDPLGFIDTVAGGGGYGFAGDGGAAVGAKLKRPLAVALSHDGQALYIADGENNRVRKVVAGSITTVAGSGVTQSVAQPAVAPDDVANNPLTLAISKPSTVAVDAAGHVYVGSADDGVILMLSDALPAPTAALEVSPSPVPTNTPVPTFTPLPTFTTPPTETPQSTITAFPTDTATAAPPAATATATAVPATATPGLRCDMTGDGTVSALDASRILAYVVGVRATCP